MLSSAVTNGYLEECGCKWSTFGSSNTGSVKIVFILLAKVIAFYVGFLVVQVWLFGFQLVFLNAAFVLVSVLFFEKQFYKKLYKTLYLSLNVSGLWTFSFVCRLGLFWRLFKWLFRRLLGGLIWLWFNTCGKTLNRALWGFLKRKFMSFRRYSKKAEFLSLIKLFL